MVDKRSKVNKQKPRERNVIGESRTPGTTKHNVIGARNHLVSVAIYVVMLLTEAERKAPVN